jgi:hypothetical protein
MAIFKVASLEDSCLNVYLVYLEAEAAAFVTLTQSESSLLRTAAPKMISTLKNELNCKMGGLAATTIRQKMLKIVLSDRFPSAKYCNVYLHKRTAKVSKQNNKTEHHSRPYPPPPPPEFTAILPAFVCTYNAGLSIALLLFFFLGY